MSLTRTFGLFLLAGLISAPLPAKADDAPTPIEPEAVSLGRPVDFATDVAPLLEANCTACHNVGIGEGGLSLEDPAGMLKGGDRGPAVVPGKPDESLLFAVAAHRSEPVMPPPDNDVEAKPFSPRELGLLRQWIAEGATAGSGSTGPLIAWRPLPASYRAIHGVALSPEARFAAVGRGNQLEVYDLALGERAARLVDPGLSSLTGEQGPLYPEGAADRDLVQAVDFGPDEALIASAGYRAVKLWRRAGLGEVTATDLAGVTALAVSPDRTQVVIAVGNEVRLASVVDLKPSSTWPVPSTVSAIAFSADGGSIAATGADGTLRTWKLTDGQPGDPNPLPSPATAVVAVGDRLVTAHEDGSLRVWNGGDQPERVLSGHAGAVRAIAAVPNRPNALLSAGDDGTVRVWDVTTESPPRVINHGAAVTGVAASPAGDIVVSCGADGAVRFWKIENGEKAGEFAGSIARRRAARQADGALEWRKQLAAVAETRRAEAEAALRDREQIVVKAGEAKTKAEQAVADARKAADEATAAAKTAADQAAASPADAALKTAADEAAKKAEEATKKMAAAEEALRSAERSVVLAGDALSGAQARFEARTREKQAAEEAATAAGSAAAAAKAEAERPVGATDVAFAPDGRRAVAGYADGTVQTFSPAGLPLDGVPTAEGQTADLFAVNDAWVWTRSADGAIRRIDVAGRWEFAGVVGPPQDAPLDLSRSAFVDRVLAVAISPDGRMLAAGGGEPSRGGELSLWNIESRSLLRTIADAHSDTVQSVAFSKDGKTLLSAAADKFAKAFDAETGAPLRSFEGHTDHVLSVAVKADGTTVATAAADTAVKVWDAETGEQRKTVTGHAKQVTAARYVGSGDEIVTASGDRTVRLYRASDGDHLRSFAGPTDYVHGVDASDDGTTIAAGGEDGVLFVWDAKTAAAKHRFEPAAPTATAAR